MVIRAYSEVSCVWLPHPSNWSLRAVCNSRCSSSRKGGAAEPAALVVRGEPSDLWPPYPPVPRLQLVYFLPNGSSHRGK